MGILSKTRYKRMAAACCLLILITLWMFYKSTNTNFHRFYVNITYNNEIKSKKTSDFLLFSSKCHIPNYDVFSDEIRRFYQPKEYIACSRQPLLSYLTKSDNKTAVVLHIDKDLIPAYSKNGVSCCYSLVTWWPYAIEPDFTIDVGACKNFINNITLTSDTFVVRCEDRKTTEEIYVNVHTSILITNKTQEKLKKHKSTSRVLSVLFVGIDSISRLNLMRMMPQTYRFLKENNWIEYKGYNKIGDNTFPNLMAIFTGQNQPWLKEMTGILLDPYFNFIFFDYSAAGYVTAYAEDELDMNPFRFSKAPTDYYLKMYTIAAEQVLKMAIEDDMHYCVGPECYGERILNIAKDFVVTFKNQPNFGWFWMSSFSHEGMNSPSKMDHKVRRFLQDITTEGVLNNTLVVFLSDHGLRFGDIRYTSTGWLEERLPYIFFSVPKWFQEHHPREYTNLVNNANKLTSPYDVYMTLQDILVKSGANYTAQPASGCPTCKSLFEEVENERSCAEAGISQHWCTCDSYNRINTMEEVVMACVLSVMDELETIRQKHLAQMLGCAKFKLEKVISSEISDNSTIPYKKNTLLKLVFKTVPYAIFEATVEVIPPSVSADGVVRSRKCVVQDRISRLSYYYNYTKCMEKSDLQMYCYCYPDYFK